MVVNTVVVRPQVTSPWRRRFNLRVRATIGLVEDPPEMCLDDTQSYLPVNAVARLVHGDLATMVVGGMASLFAQMLHPLAMAGVARHSRYREDPLGRLVQTAHFIGNTTYGSVESAQRSLERVRRVHTVVNGLTERGEVYDASDPHLLTWVHLCEARMFLEAYRRYGRTPLSSADLDAYVTEMARLADDLGAEDPPRSYADLASTAERFLPELELRDEGVVARDFLRRGFVAGRVTRTVHRLIVVAALDLLSPAERRALGVETSAPTLAGARVLMHVVAALMRSVVPPVERRAGDDG
jgi:uncharacterized protein (DUF2236 family)